MNNFHRGSSIYSIQFCYNIFVTSFFFLVYGTCKHFKIIECTYMYLLYGEEKVSFEGSGLDHSARNGSAEIFFFNQFRSRVFGTIGSETTERNVNGDDERPAYNRFVFDGRNGK